MAEFCWDCAQDVGGPDVAPELNDFYGWCEEGDRRFGLCEGCGPNFFDHEGKVVMADDDEEDPFGILFFAVILVILAVFAGVIFWIRLGL